MNKLEKQVHARCMNQALRGCLFESKRMDYHIKNIGSYQFAKQIYKYILKPKGW